MDKSDKQIAAEFDAYRAEAERTRKREAEDAIRTIRSASLGVPCCDTGNRSKGFVHDDWCQLAHITGAMISSQQPQYVCPNCGCHTVNPEHARDCSVALARTLERAVTEFQPDEDNFWHAPDENGIPCLFFKDGTRRYS